jgi:hypothetical protein
VCEIAVGGGRGSEIDGGCLGVDVEPALADGARVDTAAVGVEADSAAQRETDWAT